MGHGKLEKEQMAQNLLSMKFDRKSKNLINSLVEQKRFDETDAICIALCNVKEEPQEETE
jgi:Holliday junction resolvasome RuvABC endonuclease subunit